MSRPRGVAVVVVDRGRVVAVGVGGDRGDHWSAPASSSRICTGARSTGWVPPSESVHRTVPLDADLDTGARGRRLRGRGATAEDLSVEGVGLAPRSRAAASSVADPLEAQVLLADLAHERLALELVHPDRVRGGAAAPSGRRGRQRGHDRRTEASASAASPGHPPGSRRSRLTDAAVVDASAGHLGRPPETLASPVPVTVTLASVKPGSRSTVATTVAGGEGHGVDLDRARREGLGAPLRRGRHGADDAAPVTPAAAARRGRTRRHAERRRGSSGAATRGSRGRARAALRM